MILSLLCVLFRTERKKETAFSLDWERFLAGSAASQPHKARKALVPPSQWPLVSVMLPNRLCALHFVPAPSYGKVHWDYVQNALHSAGAYTSHHKSDSHWEAFNTTPAEPDKPSILLFIQPLLFSCVISHLQKKKKKMKQKLRANGNTATIYDVSIHTHPVSCMFCMLYALQGVQRLSHPQMSRSGT